MTTHARVPMWERTQALPAQRVVRDVPQGAATEADVVRLAEQERRFCELIDGQLVEKPVGHRESRLAMWLVIELGIYLRQHPLGMLAGPDAPHRLPSGQVRLPDVAFIPFSAIPSGDDRQQSVVPWIPALVVEILSQGNTHQEMERKLQDYFTAGVELVWIADPTRRCVQVFRAVDNCQTLTDEDLLEGGPVLPGFSCRVRDWFDSP